MKLRIKNWYDFSNLNEYIFHWNIMADSGEILAEGTKVLDCKPHTTIDIQLGNVALSKKIGRLISILAGHVRKILRW